MSAFWKVIPLAFTWPWALPFWAVMFWAYAPEFELIQKSRVSAAQAGSPDAGSMRLITFGNQFATFSAFFAAGWTETAVRPAWRMTAFWIGLALLIAGSLLRRHCWRVLGRYFTGDVRAGAGQPVIQEGAYAWVRHPSYTGGLVMFFGTGLALGNWLSVALMVGTGYAVYAYRVRVEERALLGAIGEPYRQYMVTHKRFIPFLL